jgi:hypothetical protein
MQKMPAGMTSAVTADGKKYILQTEFLNSPEYHIVTTVVFQGQVVHKVEKLYSGSIDSSENFLLAEKAVKNQHFSVARIFANRPRDLKPETVDIQVLPMDRLRVIAGVTDVVEVNSEVLSGKDIPLGNSIPALENLGLLRNLVAAVAQNSRLGKLKRAVGGIDNSKFMLTGFCGKTYLLGLKSDVDISRVLNELEMANF